MTKNIKIILRTISFLYLVLFFGCKQQLKELSLDDKIAAAVASRKIPSTK
jgi:hypothetical protein